jgi:hypothetical protein
MVRALVRLAWAFRGGGDEKLRLWTVQGGLASYNNCHTLGRVGGFSVFFCPAQPATEDTPIGSHISNENRCYPKDSQSRMNSF